MNDNISKLIQISKIIRDKEILDLKKLEKSRSFLFLQRDLLRREKKFVSELPVDDVFRLAGADLRWQNWADNRTKELYIQEAQVASLEEVQIKRAIKAFGRVNVLCSIVGVS